MLAAHTDCSQPDVKVLLGAVWMCSIAAVWSCSAVRLDSGGCEMGDTCTEHLLPSQADEHLYSEVTSLCYHVLDTLFFFKGTVLPQFKNPAKLLSWRVL